MKKLYLDQQNKMRDLTREMTNNKLLELSKVGTELKVIHNYWISFEQTSLFKKNIFFHYSEYNLNNGQMCPVFRSSSELQTFYLVITDSPE